MISVLLGLAIAFGTDPSPEGLKAVRDLTDVSTKVCAAIYRDPKTFSLDKTLTALGFTERGEREDSESGPYKLSYLSWTREDGLRLIVRLVDGSMKECSVYVPRNVWNQVTLQLPAYVKGTGLPLVADMTSKTVYQGGGYKVSNIGGGSAGGTVLKLERP